MLIIPIILSGGNGRRLWPLSSNNSPKQFIKIEKEINLLQKTVLRVNDNRIFDSPIIICQEKQKWQVQDSLKKIKINKYKLILEPSRKNTAPAITAVSLLCKENDNLILIIPVDHLIQNNEDFVKDILCAKEVAERFLVMFGIQCTDPSLPYGYIKKGKKIKNSKLYEVSNFIEKPNYESARSLFIKNYLWNSGILLFHPKVYIKEVQKLQPKLLDHITRAVDLSKAEKNTVLLEHNHYSKCTDISIDYAIMEKTKMTTVLKSTFDWIDIGTFSSFNAYEVKDKLNNQITGDGLFLESKNCSIHSEKLFTAAIGLKDTIIVSTKNAVLAVHKDKAAEIKKVTQYLEANRKQNLLNGNIEYRPWGYYENLVEENCYKIKRIVLNPKSKLSLQSHQHRAEQWTVLKGIARVTVDTKVLDLIKGESIHIPVGVKHRIENQQNKPLEIIEIQLGKSLKESDIKRFDDIYGRT